MNKFGTAIGVLLVGVAATVGFLKLTSLETQLEQAKLDSARIAGAVEVQTEKDMLLRVLISESQGKLNADQIIKLRDVIWRQTEINAEWGLTASRILAIIQQESGFDPTANSVGVGAVGLMQVMPYTASEHMTPTQRMALAQNPEMLYDIELNVTIGVKELMKLHLAFMSEGLEEVDDFRLAHTAYFWGYTGTKRLLAAVGAEAPKPSLHYANSVMKHEQGYREEVMD